MGTDSLGKQLGMTRITFTTIRGKEMDMDIEEAKALYHELQSIFLVLQPQEYQLTPSTDTTSTDTIPCPQWQSISTSSSASNERHQTKP